MFRVESVEGVCTHMYTRGHSYEDIGTYIYIYIYIYVNVYASICIYMCSCVCVYIHIYRHKHVYTYINTHIRIYINIHISPLLLLAAYIYTEKNTCKYTDKCEQFCTHTYISVHSSR